MSEQLSIKYDKSEKYKYIELPNLQIKYYNNYFDKNESSKHFKNLFDNIRWQTDTVNVWGKTFQLQRKIAWYADEGKSYRYSGKTLHPLPWTDDLIEIKYKIEKVTKTKFNSVLLNDYSSGEVGMGWHSDDEKELGTNPLIGSVSFGAERDFYLKHNNNTKIKKLKLNLTNGSYLIMMGETQHHWKHSIPKRMKIKDRRINLTFRKIL
tara:strand:+ start:107 stop:730 length:624 start_codon:yes stop_codon:yes gene_type:complete